MSVKPRHFLDLIDIPASELRGMLEASRAMKRRWQRERLGERPLAGKTLAMVFDKPSTRTRVSFDVAMRQLGGEAILLTAQEMQLGRGETLADTARVLSRYVDAIMIRILDHEAVAELARHAAIPVINGLTRRSHPCQVLADVMTYEEKRGPIRGRTVAWTGDSNNVLASWMHAAERFDFRLRVASPREDFAEVVTLLADPGSRHMTGSFVPVDAGFRLLVSIAPSDARRQANLRISEGA